MIFKMVKECRPFYKVYDFLPLMHQITPRFGLQQVKCIYPFANTKRASNYFKYKAQFSQGDTYKYRLECRYRHIDMEDHVNPLSKPANTFPGGSEPCRTPARLTCYTLSCQGSKK